MPRLLRRVLFWAHLAAGSLAGIAIFAMCLTGVLLAFQPQVLGFVERGVRRAPGPSGERLPAGTLLRLAAEASPGAAPTAVTVRSDPGESAAVAFGRDRTLFLDPVSGAALGASSAGWRAFFAKVQDVHRWLAFSEESRPAGKAITGAANLLFLGLALSGLYIWWPRLRGIRRIASVGLFQRRLSGKARDFNWHNVVGVWSAIPLVVITTTGAVISYRWAGDLVYRAFGQAPPPARGPAGGGRAAPQARPVTAGDAATLDGLWRVAERQSPGWRAITLRVPDKGKSVTFSIEEGRFLNRFARSSLTLDAKTGAISEWEPYAEAGAGRQARSWMRFLHTGESLGFAGQLVAALGSLGGAVLAVTGIALSLRRFQSWRARRAAHVSTRDEEELQPVKGATG
jgi:uncharacterized iron-regulated membrane protein